MQTDHAVDVLLNWHTATRGSRLITSAKVPGSGYSRGARFGMQIIDGMPALRAATMVLKPSGTKYAIYDAP